MFYLLTYLLTYLRQTDNRQTTDRRQTDGQRHIANMNMSSRALKTVQTMTILGILPRTPWEPAADPLWSAEPSLKTADISHSVKHRKMADFDPSESQNP